MTRKEAEELAWRAIDTATGDQLAEEGHVHATGSLSFRRRVVARLVEALATPEPAGR